MRTITRSMERLQDFLKNGSRKRKRSVSLDNEILPQRKRRRLMMTKMPPTFYQKVTKWQERKRRILLGLFLFMQEQKKKLEEQMRNDRRFTRKRLSSELFADYEGISDCKYVKKTDTTPTLVSVPKRHGMIKRLCVSDTTEVKVGPSQRRRGWRKAGEKRL